MNNINTPYDDVFRTLINDCPQLLIPIINEVFMEHYEIGEEIQFLPNEHFLNGQDGEEQKRITDSYFRIGGFGYHIECQSTPDGSMLWRMFEYDSQIALDESRYADNTLYVTFPKSAVLYLRYHANTPDEMTIAIQTAGGTVSYSVPVLKIRKEDFERIKEKQLFFLIPFYIFAYENEFFELERDHIKLKALRNEYIEIVEYLEQYTKEGILTEYTKRVILEMAKKVSNQLLNNYENVKKGIGDAMGGKVLEYEAKTILRRGIKTGVEGDICLFLEDLGEIPSEVREAISNESDIRILKNWVKLAARAVDMADFRAKSGI